MELNVSKDFDKFMEASSGPNIKLFQRFPDFWTSTDKHDQCCSCLFICGRTVVDRNHYKRPQFAPEVFYGGPKYKLCIIAYMNPM